MIDQKEIWFEFCKDYCNTDFGGGGYDTAPATVKKAVDVLVATEANRVRGVNSKTSEGMTVESYTAETISKDVRMLLNRHRKFSRG
ncbi:MAG: hypothetical protein GY941_01230 [Planctomycetes bacterium]|nr:hypothetical protein [Planctomycetota bacterium]